MKLIIERLIESVEDETGIRLTTKDFQVTADSEYVKITLWGNTLIEVAYEEGELENDEFAEDVIDEIFDEFFDLRSKIIEVKLDYLNEKLLPDFKEKILDNLTKHKTDKKLLNSLDFEFIDLGYIQGNFSQPGDEEWDFPKMALRVTDFEEFEQQLPFDPYKIPEAEVLSNEIVKRVRGKA